MILVPVRILPSKIHGLGLFATSHILSGTIVWEYRCPPDFQISLQEWKEKYADDPMWQRYRHYGYQYPQTDRIEFAADQSMFINHSNNPNIKPKNELVMVAIRDIQIGEELLCDYRDIESDLKSSLEGWK